MITPKYLKKGDKVAIVAPAGIVKKAVVKTAVDTLKRWGLKVILGEHIFDHHFQYAGTDQERLLDFQNSLDDDSVKAILCARGGYGLVRIIDQCDFTNFIKETKWIIGFSDVTILHSHLHSCFGIESLHAPMTAGLSDDVSAETLRKAIFGEKLTYQFASHTFSKKGSCKGLLVGGNLAILCSLLGSISDIQTSGKILFIEDIGEYLYRLDRMMWTLKRAGKLKDLSGMIVGGFSEMKDNSDPFGESASEIILNAVKEYNFPVCFGFPAGHQSDNLALIFGREVFMTIDNTTTIEH